MKHLSWIAAVVFLVSGSAWAWNEPAEFHGVAWGASVDDVRDMLISKRSRPSEAFCYGPVCVWDTRVGNVPARVSFEFDNKKFARGIIRFKAHDYPAIRQYLVSRYGEPTQRERYAASADARPAGVLTWEGKTVVLMLERPDANGHGRATMVLREALEGPADPPAPTVTTGGAER